MGLNYVDAYSEEIPFKIKMNKLKRRQKIEQRNARRATRFEQTHPLLARNGSQSEGEVIVPTPRRATQFININLGSCSEPWEDMEVCVYSK